MAWFFPLPAASRFPFESLGMSGRSRSSRSTARPTQDSAAPRAETPASSTPQSLGQRIWGWTNNLLASAIVLLIAVTFGWQAINSWHSVRPEAESAEDSSSNQSTPDSAIAWTFGFGSGRWSREELQATRSQAHKQLVERLSRVVLAANESTTFFASAQTDELLKTLVKRAPQWESEEGVVYLQDGPIPLALAARRAPRASAESDEASALQVLAWGLALPGPAPGEPEAASSDNAGADELLPEPDPETSPELAAIEKERLWVLTLCQLAAAPGSVSNVQLPSGVELTFAVDNPQGGRMIGFRSTLDAQALQASFDQFVQVHRQTTLGWRVEGDSLSAISQDNQGILIQAAWSDGQATGVWTENAPR